MPLFTHPSPARQSHLSLTARSCTLAMCTIYAPEDVAYIVSYAAAGGIDVLVIRYLLRL
ncbi:hypothetical protein BC827DRAFT_167413 [Russula dissimulans]|nr:hypothetical protein BC827DRAFT_167413 [Russula dissimulans]